MSRPTWDDFFYDIARLAASRATCDRAHVGVVIVKDNKVVSLGYNGAPSGMDHCDDVGHLMRDGHCVQTIHAELNAILNANGSVKGSTLYSTHLPCFECAKHIVQVGIIAVKYGYEYRANDMVYNLFDKAGVITEWIH